MKPTCGGSNPLCARSALSVTLFAATAMAYAAQPTTTGWWAVVAGAGLWWLLGHLPPARAVLPVGVVLIQIPASGFAGVRGLDPLAWLLLCVAWSLLYAAAGALLTHAATRLVPTLAPPIPWLFAWGGLDHHLVHARQPLLPIPITLGYPLVDTPLVAATAFLGPSGLGALGALLALALMTSLQALLAGDRANRAAARRWGGAAAFALLPTLAITPLAAHTPLQPPRSVGITQISEVDLLPEERLQRFLQRAQLMHADLHIWPEAALWEQRDADLAPLAEAAALLGAPLLTGVLRSAEDGKRHNGAAFADQQGARFAYDKRRLVPHFETGHDPGSGERWPIRSRDWRLGLLICWESLFFDLALQRVQAGAEVLVVLAHAGWAGESASGWWHAEVARVLAWSLGVPVLFASHEGPSVGWSHDGRRIGAAPAGEGVLWLQLAVPSGWRTPYRTLGASGVAWLWGGAFALSLSFAAHWSPRGRVR
jgi:apolipoprotein N-acyltransferase